MSTPTIPTLPGCGRGASVRIEVYSPAGGQLHGSLVAVAYACDRHAIEPVSALYAAGFTPHRTAYEPRPGVLSVCGYLFRFGSSSTSTAVTTVQGPAVTAGTSEVPSTMQGHPAWCARVTDDGPCEVAGWHASEWIAVDSDENDAPGIKVQLFGAESVAVALLFTYEGETSGQLLPLDQAATLAGVLSGLVTRAGAR